MDSWLLRKKNSKAKYLVPVSRVCGMEFSALRDVSRYFSIVDDLVNIKLEIFTHGCDIEAVTGFATYSEKNGGCFYWKSMS